MMVVASTYPQPTVLFYFSLSVSLAFTFAIQTQGLTDRECVLHQVILAMQVCDGDLRNCFDGSDEEVDLCKGGTPTAVIAAAAVAMVYVVAGEECILDNQSHSVVRAILFPFENG